MNTRDKVNLYRRLLRKAKVELRRAAEGLPSEYFIPVTSAQLDPEVVSWFHGGQDDPVYALGSRLFSDRPADVGRTKASVKELEALESTLESWLLRFEQGREDETSDEDLTRIEKLLANTKKLLSAVGSGRFEQQDTGMDGFNFEEFFEAYIEAALWSSTAYGEDEEDDDDDVPMDSVFGSSDIDVGCLEKMRRDCQKFVEENAELLAQADYGHGQYSDEELAGHDFWLTRVGSGSGFMDRDLGDVGDQLADSARAFREVWLDGLPSGEGGVSC